MFYSNCLVTNAGQPASVVVYPL